MSQNEKAKTEPYSWGNFDYNKGYNDGMAKAAQELRHKDLEIANLTKRIKELTNNENTNTPPAQH